MNGKTLPAVYYHSVEVYNVMKDKAVANSDGLLVYEGYTTKLFKELTLAVPLYSAVMNHLKRMDCIRQIVRGGGGSPSRWAVLQSPTPELFEASPGYKVTTKDNILAQRIRDQQEQINTLTDRLEIVEAKIGA